MSLSRLMTPGVLLAAVAAILPSTAFSAVGVWSPAGPHGADVRGLAVDPSVPGRVFAATASGGVFLSLDGGQNWVPRSAGLPKDAATSAYKTLRGVTVDPALGRVYASGVDLYYSDNLGQTWNTFSLPPGAVGGFSVLYLDPDDSQKLTIQSVSGVFVYDLVGGGPDREWTEPAGITDPPVWALLRTASDADRFYAVAGNTPTLYDSRNRVASWSAVGVLPGTKFRALSADPADPDRLYLSVDTGCFLSTDAGVNWTRMDDPTDEAEVYRFGDVAGRVLAVGRGGLYSNFSNADKLAAVGSFLFTRATDLVTLSDGSLLMGSQMGVFAGPSSLVEGTGAFEHRSRGMDNADISAVVPAPGSDVVYAAAGQGYDAGVFRSDDAGQTWELRSRGITNPDVRCIAVFRGNPDIVYIGTALAIDDTGENGKIFKTVNGGQSWTDVTAGLPHSGSRNVINMAVHPTDPDIVYASAQGILAGIYKSEDGGQTWLQRSSGLESMPSTPGHEEFHNYFSMLALAMDPRNSETLFIGSGGCWGGTYRTTDGAQNWVRRAQYHMEWDSKAIDYGSLVGDTDFWFPVHLTLYDLDIDPNDANHLFVNGGRGDYFGGDQVGIVYESTDWGESWSLVRENTKSDYFVSPVTGLEMHRYRPGELFVSTRDGVRFSDDGGTSWAVINEGLGMQNKFTRALAMDEDDPNRVYLATALSGVWVRELEPVAVEMAYMEVSEDAEGRAEVRWGVTDATDHAGFYVDREVDGVRGRLTGTLLRGREEYVFVDGSPVADRLNRYWIVELDRAGRETEYGPLDIFISGTTPHPSFSLSRANPNPFSVSTRLRVVAPYDAERHPVVVRIYDTQGRRVATLGEGITTGGYHDIQWGGKDDQGRTVRSGIYYIRAVSGSQQRVERVLVVR